MTTRPGIDRRSKATWLLAAAVLASACAGSPRATQSAPAGTQVLTVPQVVQMTQNGFSFEAIMGRIEQTGTVYRLTDDQAAMLRGSGLTATLVSYMQMTYTNAVQRNPALGKSDDHWTKIDAYWYGGRPFGWPEDWIVGAPRFGEKLRGQ